MKHKRMMPGVPRTARLFASTCYFAIFGWLVSSSAIGQDLDSLEERAILQAVDRVAKSVVQIETVGGLDRVGDASASLGPTTGLVVSADGFVLSSAFNFVQQPTSIIARLPDGNRVTCQIVARDHSRHLVLLKLDTDQQLAEPEFVDRSGLRVGQWAIAVGRAFNHAEPNISAGILSATNRIWGKAVQCDAKISPNNFGGALIDIQGRVIGILTPLSPNKDSEMAGTEWYDSGIGFAVPLAEIREQIESMKAGNDQHTGKLGITFVGKNVYADRPEIAALVGTSPAAAAGLQSGDIIVGCQGQPVRRQSELKHLVESRYAGETIRLAVQRDGSELQVSVELAKSIDPFTQSWIGLIPKWSEAADPLVVEQVLPGTPAETAGIEAGDEIVRLAGKAVANLAAVRLALIGQSVDSQIELEIKRKGVTQALRVELSQMQADVPDQVTALKEVSDTAGTEAVSIEAVRVPEMPNLCHALVPGEPKGNYGLLVWVPQPGDLSAKREDEQQAADEFEKYVEPWKEICRRSGFILLVPRPVDSRRWQTDEAEMVQKAVDQLKLNYKIDPDRIAIGGVQAGGAMASVVTFQYRDVFRGLFLADADIPPSVGRISADPVNRLQVLLASNGQEEEESEKLLQKLAKSLIPAAETELPQSAHPELIGRWMLCLTRL